MDTTRIFALVSWPVATYCVVHSLRLRGVYGETAFGRQLRGAIVGLAILGVLGPRVYAWDGEIHGPPFAETYLALAWAVRGIVAGN